MVLKAEVFWVSVVLAMTTLREWELVSLYTFQAEQKIGVPPNGPGVHEDKQIRSITIMFWVLHLGVYAGNTDISSTH